MYEEQVRQIKSGCEDKYHQKNAEANKLFVRDRLTLLLDPGFEVEDGLFANWTLDKLAADGVVTVVGKMHGRTVCVMANDSTIKAGSWGKRTVEKILRIQETAYRLRVPLIYLVDSAGARITDQGVEQLHGITSLEEVMVGDTQVTAAGIQNLRAALPNTKIYHTVGGRGQHEP